MSRSDLRQWLGFIDPEIIKKEELPHSMRGLAMSILEDLTLY